MAKKTKLYNVGYGQNSGEPNVDFDVDLFDLPYDKATPDDPLVIFFGEDEEKVVDMGKCKNRPWPDFSNVCIAGALDCQDFTIDANTVLPICFDKLICRHSINDLGVLIGLLPADFMTAPEPTIVVRSAILNNVKANKDGALSTARRFMEKYPNVVVTDEKKLVLSEIVAEHDRAKSEPVITASTQISVGKKPAKKNSATTIKDDNWLSTEEMVERCKEASQLIAGLSVDQTARYIKMARSVKAGLGLTTTQCARLSDGATITCVHISEVQRVVDYIERAVSEAAVSAANKSEAVKVQKKPVPSASKVVPRRPKYYIGDKEVKPAKIKKYISKNVFSEIASACSKNTSLLLTILNDINVINIAPTDTNGRKVYYIQDNKVETATSMEFKNVNCFAQGFETRQSRQRLVWGISGDCFVCEKFFSDHDSRDKAYQKYIRNLSLDVSKLDLSEYLYVPDLIAELSAGKEIVSEPADTPVVEPIAKPVVEPVVKPVVEPIAKPVEQTSTVVAQRLSDDPAIQTLSAADAETVTDEPVEPVVKNKKRTRLIRTKYEQTRQRPVVEPVAKPAVEPVAKPVVETVAKPVVEPVAEPVVPNTSDENVSWAELYAIHGKFQDRMNVLGVTQAALIRQLSQEQDTNALLMTTKNLQYVLEQKQECERALEKMRQMNEALKKLQQMLDERKI